ncbi:hypothetical protein LVY65_05830 [Sphingomonas sp. G124]|uniref:Uncharacterized protein n=1 Tax=Sphingomonas cremea TaxID=2904799 RepID=A0A9X1TVV4_9SPHN|nr:hypothetical protein [Sphingomonas cremea]MCF2514584.1 hypothetical protein [Sphingomonas cremea]
MTLLLKDPEATLDYSVDWGCEYLAGDALASSDWAISPAEVGGVSVVSSRFDLLMAAVQVEGGIAGRLYRLANHVVTVEGREDSRSIMLRVEKR